ncbi:MAG: peptide chain release factor N(5)-glutamine methyltransferase [Candidatus Symbiothrix sp.]|jgi:release factor glutamine methyltransferase|nr:peptide chain release factor N(5)-glutamine methyltransferase [Candidatus Symbiothrix sp.]
MKQLSVISDRLPAFYSDTEKKVLCDLILQFVCKKDIHALLRDKDTQLSANEVAEIEKIVAELKKNRPIHYILGETEFYGLKLAVNENVLIPRPETEELVDLILRVKGEGCEVKGEGCEVKGAGYGVKGEGCRILDIGTGSGCIAIALAKKLPDATVYALDISEQALEVARKNADMNHVNVHFFQQNILSSTLYTLHSTLYTLHSTLYDIIVSNPPYIPPSEKVDMCSNVLDYEPHEALFVPENEPLVFYERIADIGRNLLRPYGQLFFEINARFGAEIVQLLNERGYTDVQISQDISGKDRFIYALWKTKK